MRRTSLHATLIAVLAAMLTATLAPAAVGQSGRTTGGGGGGAVGSARLSERDPLLIDVDFPGGTLQQYSDAILAATDQVTIVCTPPAAKAPLQPISLRGVTFAQALEIPAALTPGVEVDISRSQVVREGVGKDHITSATVAMYSINLAEAAAIAERPAPPLVFDLDFPGGTAAAFVAAVRKALPSANVAVDAAAERFTIPPAQFRAVTLQGALDLLNSRTLSDDAGWAKMSVKRLDGNVGFHVDVEEASQEARHRVWSLANVLGDDIRPEDALSAVQAAMSLFRKPAELKYHPETNLLIARGTEAQLDLINTTLDQAAETAHQRGSMNEQRREELQHLELQARMVEARMNVAAQRLDIFRKALDRMQQQVETGAAPQEFLDEAKLKAAQAEADFIEAQAQLQMTLTSIDSIQKRIKKNEDAR